MMKAPRLFVAGAAVALLPISAVIAQSSGPTPADPAAKQSGGTTFESLDVNSDGRISKDEAKANANVTAQFSSYDVNGDGFIERAEVTQASKPAAETPPQQQ
jgi:Ca2+-binding EF-hand superfamily protein